jgi:hypothetical protein
MPGMLPGAMPGGPLQGGPMGQPPGANPAMRALEGLSGVPAPQRELKAMAEASAHIQIALAGVYTRSAKASELLSKAYENIQKARQVMEELSQQPVGPPPDLLGSLTPLSQGPPSPMIP